MGGFVGKLFSSSPNEPRILQLPNTRVQIVKKIGTGGFATVFLVKDQSRPDKFLALKRFECLNDETRVQFAQTEINTLKKLSAASDHIIKLIDTDERAFVLLPFYDKGSIQSIVDKERKIKNIEPYIVISGLFTKSEILQISLDICDAIRIFHENGLSHRDIAPGNILIYVDDNNKRRGVLMDFGSTAPAKVDTSAYANCVKLQELAESTCSALYRAPELYEVFADSLIDGSGDIWSLGCVMYFMMYGISPFEFSLKEGGSLKLAVVSGVVKFPNDVPGYDAELESLIKQILVPDPSNECLSQK